MQGKKEKKRLKAERKANKLAETKEKELHKAVSAFNKARELARTKEKERVTQS